MRCFPSMRRRNLPYSTPLNRLPVNLSAILLSIWRGQEYPYSDVKHLVYTLPVCCYLEQVLELTKYDKPTKAKEKT